MSAASPYPLAAYFIRTGETDRAFAWLERGYRERDPPMISLKSYPVFDPLRSDPCYPDLVRRIGFSEK